MMGDQEKFNSNERKPRKGIKVGKLSRNNAEFNAIFVDYGSNSIWSFIAFGALTASVF